MAQYSEKHSVVFAFQQVPIVASSTTPKESPPLYVPSFVGKQKRTKSPLLAFSSLGAAMANKLPTPQPSPNRRPSSSSTPSAAATVPGRIMTTSEMVATTAAGTLLIVGVIYTLAMNGEITDGAVSREALEAVSYNVVDAALPMTASDVVSVAAGEALAGVVGATTSLSISLATSKTAMRQIKPRQPTEPKKATTSTIKVSDAVADGDFLLTSAAASPLLAAIGLSSPIVLVLTSTLLAIVPYGIVKVGARRREALKREDAVMQSLLVQQQQQQRPWWSKMTATNVLNGNKLQQQQMSTILVNAAIPVATATTKSTVVDLSTLTPVREDKPNLDAVEVIADILKWLQFNVLTSDFGGHLLWQGQELPIGVESAILGSVAGVSSQFYSDILYGTFSFGSPAQQDAVKARSLLDWINLYTSKTIYYAVLFGVYQAVQEPAVELVAALLSGGAEACYGSENVRACVETYVANNPPGASPEAQFRSFVTAAISFWNNYGVSSWFSPVET